MDIDAIIANAEDLHRLRTLEAQRHFKAGFAAEARVAAVRYLARIVALRGVFGAIPYCGPTVTENQKISAPPEASSPSDGDGLCHCDFCTGTKRWRD